MTAITNKNMFTATITSEPAVDGAATASILVEGAKFTFPVSKIDAVVAALKSVQAFHQHLCKPSES